MSFSKPRSSRGDEAQTSRISEKMEPPYVGCYSVERSSTVLQSPPVPFEKVQETEGRGGKVMNVKITEAAPGHLADEIIVDEPI